MGPSIGRSVDTSTGVTPMSPIIRSDIAQISRHGSSGRRPGASAIIASAAAVALLVSASTFARAADNSTRMAQEHHACAVVLGLDPSGDRYDTCVRSLSRSLSEWDQAALIESYRTACAEKGLEPGTTAFAVCAVSAGQSQ
jgi:hypothetical protein